MDKGVNFHPELLPVPVILGPTAVGKTDASIILARSCQGEIISADAFQVYRGMNIATAKPPPGRKELVPHHLIDILDPGEEYNAALFRRRALVLIEAIRSRGRFPLVVGGSGLYLRALVDGLFDGPSVDREYRRRLRREGEEKGPEYLYKLLAERDRLSARRIHPHNIKRIIRALEVLKVTGRPISSRQTQWREFQPGGGEATGEDEAGQFLLIGLRRRRPELYRRINQRVDRMFAEGLVEETRTLLAADIDRNQPSWKALGYREVAAYLAGEYCEEEARRRLARNTRRYAKRQMTWWRKDQRIKWIDLAERDCPETIAEQIKRRIFYQ